MVKKIGIILFGIMSILLVSCTNSKANNVTTTNQQETSSVQADSSSSLPIGQPTTEESTTEQSIINPSSGSEWNPAEEGETLCYEEYSDEQFEKMEEVFKNEMSQQMLSYLNSGKSVWIGPLYWECLLLSDMELNPSVVNEKYSVEHKESEHFDEKVGLYIQAHYPYIEIKENKKATDIANEEIKKFIMGNYYGLTDEEFLEEYSHNPTLCGQWFSYYTIGYMDEEVVSIVFRDAQRLLRGITINIKTGKPMTLEELGVTDERLLDELERTPDHVVSAFYMKYSKECIKDMIESGYSTENSFIIGDRLYLWSSEWRGMHIFFGYDGILFD